MRRFLFHVLCVFVLCQCEYSKSIDRNSQDWNANRIWKPLPGAPTDFIPQDFAARDLARTPGHWVVDPQDHCRFFIPNQGTASHRADVLEGEAWKATNRCSRAKQGMQNTLTTAALPLHVATLGIWAKHSWWQRLGEPGQSYEDDDSSGDLFREQVTSTEHKTETSHKSESSHHEAHSTSNSRSVTEALHEAHESKSKADADDLRKDFPVGKKD